MTRYPNYDPSLGRVKLAGGGEVTVCNSDLNLSTFTQCTLIQRARRRFAAADRNTLQFAADLRRLHDAGVHEGGNFAVWASEIFDGLSKANAKMLCWQGALLLILDGHELIDIEDRKLRIGVTAVRKLGSLLSNFDEEALLMVWQQMDQAKPVGRLVESDVVAAMQDTGYFILNRQQQQQEEEEGEEGETTIHWRVANEDLADAPALAVHANKVNQPGIEAIVHLHQELVDPFDKLRRELVKLTDPDNQPYDLDKIKQQFNKAVDLLLALSDLLDEHDQAA